MKLFRHLAMIASLALVALSPAIASDRPSFTGFYGGIHGGMDLTTTDVAFGGLGINGLSGNGEQYGVHGGFDLHVKGTPIVIGLGADYTWSNASFTVTPGILSADLNESWSVTGRLGYAMGKAMAYALAGYTQADVSASLLGTGIGGTTLDGWIIGAGAEFMIAGGVSIAGEYRFTRFDGLNFGGPGGLDLDTDRHEIRAALRYRFNPL